MPRSQQMQYGPIPVADKIDQLSPQDRALLDRARTAIEAADMAADKVALCIDECVKTGRISYGMLEYVTGRRRENIYRRRKTFRKRVGAE